MNVIACFGLQNPPQYPILNVHVPERNRPTSVRYGLFLGCFWFHSAMVSQLDEGLEAKVFGQDVLVALVVLQLYSA